MVQQLGEKADKGLGVFLNEGSKPIPVGNVVLQYKGVIITGTEADQLAAVYASEAKSGKDEKLDAKGGIVTSCGNCFTRVPWQPAVAESAGTTCSR
jgi:hypothetical protein